MDYLQTTQVTKSILMAGQFSPPITGEYEMNIACRDYFVENSVKVDFVDTCLISDAADVGRMSVKKLLNLTKFYFRFLLKIPLYSVVYLTPGQTLFGALRFIPFLTLSLLLKKSVFCHWHGYGILPLVERHPLLRRIYFSSKIKSIILTHDLEQKLRRHVGNTPDIFILRNYSNIPISENDSTNERLQVLFLSSLVKEKGIEEFLCAATDPQTSFIDFHVCGNGSNEVIKEVRDCESKGKLKFHGVVFGEKKKHLFSSADVFVLPTYYPTEGVPLSLLEALSSGCAIITTKHNGIPETIGSAGIFIDIKCSSQLIDALLKLDANRTLLNEFKTASISQSKSFSKEVFFSQLSSILGIRYSSLHSPSA